MFLKSNEHGTCKLRLILSVFLRTRSCLQFHVTVIIYLRHTHRHEQSPVISRRDMFEKEPERMRLKALNALISFIIDYVHLIFQVITGRFRAFFPICENVCQP